MTLLLQHTLCSFNGTRLETAQLVPVKPSGRVSFVNASVGAFDHWHKVNGSFTDSEPQSPKLNNYDMNTDLLASFSQRYTVEYCTYDGEGRTQFPNPFRVVTLQYSPSHRAPNYFMQCEIELRQKTADKCQGCKISRCCRASLIRI
jgi:hypothetical protein